LHAGLVRRTTRVRWTAKSATAATGQVNQGQTVSQRGKGSAAVAVKVAAMSESAGGPTDSARNGHSPGEGRSRRAARRRLAVARARSGGWDVLGGVSLTVTSALGIVSPV